MAQVLMPKATAVWLVENTALTFEQIADFCVLHPLEVKGIADGDVAAGIRGADPISNGQLTREEIEKAEKDANYRMKQHVSRHASLQVTERKGARYTPISRRQDRPDAIAWMLRHHPEVPDSQVAKILGTTKSTIDQIRNRTHWNATNIKPSDPVTLGLCTQIELDALVRKSSAKKEKMIEEARALADEGPSLSVKTVIASGVSVDSFDMGDDQEDDQPHVDLSDDDFADADDEL